MASLALGIAGGALLGPVGGAIGAALGSYIDRQFIFKPDSGSSAPQRVGSLNIQQSNEGAPILYPLGSKTRVAATLIAVSDLVVTETEEEGAGGKQGNQKLTTQHYFVNLMALVCGREIVDIRRIRANGTTIYLKRDAPLVYTDDVFSTETTVAWDQGAVLKMYILSPNGGPNLTLFLPGAPLDVSGFGGGDTANNGSWTLIESGFRQAGVTFALVGYSGLFTEVATGTYTITLEQTVPEFTTSVAADIRIYTGTETQGQDSVVTDDHGFDVPAFRGLSGVAFELLSLDAYGGMLPQLSFEVDCKGAIQTNAQLIQDIMTERANIDEATWFDVSQLATSGQLSQSRGYVLEPPMSTADALRPLLMAHFIGLSEQNGKLVFYDRGDEATVTVEDGHLAAHMYGSDAPRRVKKTDPDPETIPRQVNVRYLDTGVGMQPAQQSERAYSYLVTGDHVLDVDLPLVMGAENARKIARRILWDSITQARRVEFSLPPTYLAIAVGDRVEYIDEGETVTAIVTEVEIGANFIINCMGFVEESQTADVEDGVGDDPADDPDDDDIVLPSDMAFILIDIPPLSSEHLAIPGYYFAAALSDRLAGFSSATVFESLDDVNYTELETLGSESTIGSAEDNFLDPGPVNYWDHENEINIRLIHGTLGTKTQIEVLNGGNWAFYGGEILAFQTAVLEADGTYTISDLLRGLLGTEAYVDAHGVDETFVLFNITPNFEPINVAEIGVDRYWKAVPSGGNVDDAFAYGGTPSARNLLPFSPINIRGLRDGIDDDVLISWTRRTRAATRFFAFMTAPLEEQIERYILEVYYDGTYTSIAATKTITEAIEYDYTAGEQTTDGLTPGNPVYVILYQVSATVGRGTGRRGVV